MLLLLAPLGQVYRALRHGTSEVAVKHIPRLADDPERLRRLVRREIAILKRVSYDCNVVQFYGACSGDDGAWVCMELMEVIAGPRPALDDVCVLPQEHPVRQDTSLLETGYGVGTWRGVTAWRPGMPGMGVRGRVRGRVRVGDRGPG